MAGESEVRVSYGVKELLGRIDTRLESIDNKLDTKADLRDLIELRDRLSKIEKRWEERMAVEADLKQRAAATFTRRDRVIATIVAIVAILIQPLQQHFHF